MAKMICTAKKGQGQRLQQGILTPDPVLTTAEGACHVLGAQGQVGKCDLTAAHKEKQINKQTMEHKSSG